MTDIELIDNSEFVTAKSSISFLCFFLNEKGIVVVGGRLQNSQLSFNSKDPVIIPGKHKLSELIVKQFQVTHLHAGRSLLANILKQNYWIVEGKTLIRKIVNDCIVRHRFKAAFSNQLMENLSQQMVTLKD
ncbi:integrase catalytic domain-containing protein [Nephila pilipes]|uniref:Integrase catalytic domain-containing protein n=1 Tax=Nephila pilipes TaxID=299642 RepID=A0A8X6P6S9_NEPPI|nr:integrase catalytic domain-containing protein [Nephila pilipes]